ncbi:5,10-methylenetetrahydrofolate reductase [Janibacter anophelis]|uniref:5,10-methylenetetrahydrofolate reductase n=1 Tax=Janibacter anophelis TaxID=319054 RepID=UPI000A079A74|nr:5,10-methylenetetrahydrofolate reductase [Janibacter anophelis]
MEQPRSESHAPSPGAFPAAARNPREVLLFGLTPPRAETDPERITEIAERTLARVEALPVDALVLYDITDEADRNDQPRPFPFAAMLDPGDYLCQQLSRWDRPAIIYRAVGKYGQDELSAWLRSAPDNVLTVFVGSSSSQEQVRTTLTRALELHREVRPSLPLGSVTIPERHATRGDEHERLLTKQRAGSSFFVSQIVYDITAAKNLASDYRYAVASDDLDPAPLIFTLSLCGSAKTLSFLEWLGVDVPTWVRNEIVHADDPLQWSTVHALNAARELSSFCRYLGIPFGFNIESVSSRKVEIEAAVELTHRVAELLERD